MGDKKKKDMCDECGERKASIYVTEFADGAPVKKYICQHCYDSVEGAPSLSSSEFFAKLVEIIAPELHKAGKQRCPECGQDYIEFRQTFQFGCPNDYEVFHDALDDLLTGIHGAKRHTGKVPEGRAQALAGGRQRLKVLMRELKKAIAEEDFERAAELKSRIEQMEQASVGDTEK